MSKRFICCLFFVVFGWTPLNAQVADNIAKIGVLAYRGEQQLVQRWSGLKAYLDTSVAGWTFELVPITLKTAASHIENGDLHFILTNPGHFSVLDRDFPMSVIASRQRRASDGSYVNEFGSVIFARADTGISMLQDVVGKTVVAIDPQAFGGFQLAWREFEDVGVDVFHDTEKLTYVGFPMDQVFEHVRSGAADVGIARSGLMETMAGIGAIDADEFVVLNTSVTYGHPERLSTRLYPEWPFAALAATSADLRDSVSVALLTAEHSPVAAAVNLTDFWSSPMPYHSVRGLMSTFHERLATLEREHAWYTKPWVLLLIMAALVVALIAFTYVYRKRADDQLRAQMQEVGGDTGEDLHVTPREREVLDLISTGDSTKEIARKLGISPKTVEFHRSNLLRKYGARTSSQLIALST